MARALINVPKTAKAGELVEIKTLIAHPMSTGYVPGPNGQLIPRNIITELRCAYDGEEVFSAELSPATAANPYVVFQTLATVSGTLALTWRGDNGFEQTETVEIVVA
jgi:sulfur-oxidizing protein SoxZ